MTEPKSTVEEIRARFDADVERFSNLETGQSATIDAPLMLELVACAAAEVNPDATALLDIGCGAGNYSLKVLERLPNLDVTLIDLSRPMLERALERVGAVTSGTVEAAQCDIRDFDAGEQRFDLIVAAAVLHHLRNDDEWIATFQKCYRALRPGGSLWIADLVAQTSPGIQAVMWSRYGDYLARFRDGAYRDQVLAYVAREDTPRPLIYQVDLMRAAGFRTIEILHKNGPFAAFGGIR